MYWTSQMFVNNTFPASADIDSNSNSISLSQWATLMSRHLIHYLMKPLRHCAVPSHRQRQVFRRNQPTDQLWLRAHHTCSVIIRTHLFRNSNHIINSLLQRQVRVKVLRHQQLWIHLCCSTPKQVMIVPSSRQTWCNTWFRLHNKPNLLQKEENFAILFSSFRFRVRNAFCCSIKKRQS